MKTWDEWSDKEVNQAVTHLVFKCVGWSLTENGCSFYHCGIDGSGYYSQSVISYCSSPADMWPIMIDESIIVGFSDEYKKYMAIGEAVIDDAHFICSDNITYYHASPLRAAAIVLLEMNGVKP